MNDEDEHLFCEYHGWEGKNVDVVLGELLTPKYPPIISTEAVFVFLAFPSSLSLGVSKRLVGWQLLRYSNETGDLRS